jgi:SAM-dependent methyltransferase
LPPAARIPWGIDQSAEMIAQARRQFPSLEFEVCDAREIPSTGEFDAVFSNAALHWIPEAEKVIRGVARALKPNGRFVAEMGGKGNIRRLVEAIAGACREVGIDRGARHRGMVLPQHRRVCRASGEAWTRGSPGGAFRAAHPARGWRKGAGSLAAHVQAGDSRSPSRRRQDAFLREVERQARPELFKDGVWELDYRRLRIVAWKQA